MDEHGFTLIEVLIAITIAGIITGVIFTFFDLGFSTWEQANVNNNLEQQWRVINSFLKNDLHNIFNSSISQKNQFRGDNQKMEWIILEEDKLKQVTYLFDLYHNKLIRKVKSIEGNKTFQEMVFFSELDLSTIKFNYYDVEHKYWKNTWSYQNEGRYPLAVKIMSNTKLPNLIIDIYVGRKY